MAEKVIFEFRAGEYARLGGAELQCGEGHSTAFGPWMWACCHAAATPQGSQDASSQRSHRTKSSARRHLRETLDIFQRMYDDLYGGKDSD